jgi:hypothetical protein
MLTLLRVRHDCAPAAPAESSTALPARFKGRAPCSLHFTWVQGYALRTNGLHVVRFERAEPCIGETKAMLAESLVRMEVEKIVERKLDAVGHLRGCPHLRFKPSCCCVTPRLSIRLRIWGSGVRISPGAPG